MRLDLKAPSTRGLVGIRLAARGDWRPAVTLAQFFGANCGGDCSQFPHMIRGDSRASAPPRRSPIPLPRGQRGRVKAATAPRFADCARPLQRAIETVIRLSCAVHALPATTCGVLRGSLSWQPPHFLPTSPLCGLALPPYFPLDFRLIRACACREGGANTYAEQPTPATSKTATSAAAVPTLRGHGAAGRPQMQLLRVYPRAGSS